MVSFRLSIPGGSDGKVSVYNEGDLGSIPGLGRSPGEGNGISFEVLAPSLKLPALPVLLGNWRLVHHENSASGCLTRGNLELCQIPHEYTGPSSVHRERT